MDRGVVAFPQQPFPRSPCSWQESSARTLPAPRWRRGAGHATTIAGADGSTHPLRRKWTGDCFHGFAEPDDDTGRLSASSELLQFARLVAASGDDARFPDAEYYQRIARTLEDGKIQMAFLDDRLALPDIYTGHRHAEAIGAGVRAVKLDPCTIMMAMGMVTQPSGARDLLHDLLRAVPRRARLRDDGSDAEGPRRRGTS